MSWRVPFVDFPGQFRLYEAEIMGTVRETLASGDLILRHQLDEFENHLAEFVGTAFAVGVSNCTDALRLLRHAYDWGPGDEIISVAHTFVATVSPFKLAGCTPVLVDIGTDHNMDVEALAHAVTERTKAVVPVHLNGRICDMDRIKIIARDAGAVILEDAAQALGASFKGQSAGTFGAAGVFSFYPAKLLGAFGDAGAVVTDDASLAEEIRMLRDHGRIGKIDIGGWGYNCRLDNMQAALLDKRLFRLPRWIERRRELAERYDNILHDVPGLRTLPSPSADPNRFDVYQNYPVLTGQRDQLVSFLTEASVETLISWPIPMHHHSSLGLSHLKLPATEELSQYVVSLPLFPELTDEQVDLVANLVARFPHGN